jgi:complement component 1 Q subcomponent-binding protein, mitochondrial
LAYEKESAQSVEPDFVKAFTAQGVWSIQDSAGADEVALERKFGNETVRLMFSVADLDAQPESEVEIEGENTEGEPASDSVTSTPLRVAITVTKRGATGAMNVDAVCQDGAFLIENVSFYSDAEVGTSLTAEADWKRRGLYLGPTFENLDPAVQDEFERFLEERGINESLALFIPDFAEYKEQNVG